MAFAKNSPSVESSLANTVQSVEALIHSMQHRIYIKWPGIIDFADKYKSSTIKDWKLLDTILTASCEHGKRDKRLVNLMAAV